MAIFGILLVSIFVVLFIPNPEWFYPFLGLSQENETSGLSPKNEALRFLGFGIGGTLLALGAVIANRRAKALENTANAQVKATQNQARANETQEQGLRQERLKNAIEHLKSRSASVRLGGAYELFHLAKDTRDLDQTEDLSQTALDILCAHIRLTAREKEYTAEDESEPSEEIQSLLNLLFVQDHEVFKDRNINLRGAFLRGADLKNARLQKINLEGADLQGADLGAAQLQGADLWEAQLQGADLWEAQLQGAYLGAAQLQNAYLWEAQLQDAYLMEAQLQGADLWEAQLQGAYLGEAQLQGAYLMEAQLQGAYLREAQLQGAYLMEAQLQGAYLMEAQLQGAYLMEAQLQGAYLMEAQLQGVVSGNKVEPMHRFIVENNIRQQIGKESDLSRITFSGGLTQKNVDDIVESMPNDESKKWLREQLIPHVGKPPNSELPKDNGAVTGSYTKKEAEKWIAEYNEAMGYKEDPTP